MNAKPESETTLHDGTAAWSPPALLAHLDHLGVEHATALHEPVYTVEEAKRLRGAQPGGHSKNLFLRNNKGAMWLVICHEDRRIDLRAFADRLGAGRFSFASPRRLRAYLGVIPGAVTPFAVVNDADGLVRVVLDQALLALDPLHFHPLDNAMTTTVSADGLLRFLASVNHSPEVVDLDEFEVDPRVSAC